MDNLGNKHFKKNDKYSKARLLRSQNIKKFKETLKLKIDQVVENAGRDHIQINIFNSDAIKEYNKVDIHTCWIEDKDTETNTDVAVIIIYITEEHKAAPTEEQWMTMFGFTSKEHEWSKTNQNIYLDLNGLNLTEYNHEKAGLVFIPDEENKPLEIQNTSSEGVE